MTKYANILSYSHSLRGSTTSNYTATRVVGKLTDIRINPHNTLCSEKKHPLTLSFISP